VDSLAQHRARKNGAEGGGMSGAVILDGCSWNHGRTKSGEATFINAPDEDGEEVLVAIVSASLCRELREEIAQKICLMLSAEVAA